MSRQFQKITVDGNGIDNCIKNDFDECLNNTRCSCIVRVIGVDNIEFNSWDKSLTKTEGSNFIDTACIEDNKSK